MVNQHNMNKTDYKEPDMEKFRKNPFLVPDGYFKSFPSRLNERIRHENLKPISSSQPVVWRPYLAAAILIILALVAGKFVMNFSHQQTALHFQAEITKTVNAELYSISDETIWELIESEAPRSNQNSGVVADEAVDYLLNEDIPEDELFNVF